MWNYLTIGMISLLFLNLGCNAPLALKANSSTSDELMAILDPDLHSISTQYFPADETQKASSRIFRLTRKQIDLTTQSLLPSHYTSSITKTMPKDPLQTNYEYAEILNFNLANFPSYVAWVENIVSSVRNNPYTLIDCRPSGSSKDCLKKQAEDFIVKAFRGPLSADQLTKFTDFFLARIEASNFSEASSDLVDIVLNSPHFLFREEVQVTSQNFLLPHQRLQNISYTLADVPPEGAQLSSSLAPSYLQTSQSTKDVVNKVLATTAARDKLLRFFISWLEVKEADEFTISSEDFPEFDISMAEAVVDETKKFLNFHLSKAAPKLKDLTQSSQSFISQSLETIYNVSTSSPSGNTIVDLDPTKRLGLFTQSAVIASHSGPSDTRLVKRGVFFTRKVMCLELGGVPSGIDTNLGDTEGTTERQRIERVTSQGSCVGCHQYINPFGFIQENYDPIGRWRETDNNLPIDASISVDFLDEGRLNTDSPVVALKEFTNSYRFKQCFVRQLFRYYTGRQETPSDDPLLRKMFFYFTLEDNQDILGLLEILTSSERFSQRSGENL